MDDEAHEELDIPDGVHGSKRATEVLRAWIADGSLHVALSPEVFSHDVSEWGRLLSDIASHVANAVALDGQMDRHEALKVIDAAFDRGLLQTSERPSQTLTGKIKRGTRH